MCLLYSQHSVHTILYCCPADYQMFVKISHTKQFSDTSWVSCSLTQSLNSGTVNYLEIVSCPIGKGLSSITPPPQLLRH